ncbi:hypothetical protein ABZ568_12640 [Streptomyces olindensis]|uniref:Secreted protein n=1 Tax=Streptomyces olindensis TaxID=358823 RepID=A0ABV2XT97_9ACTN
MAALAAAAGVAAVAVPAAATTTPAFAEPRFLEPADLPPHPASPWYGGPAGCAKKLMQKDPDLTATGKHYGRLNVEEGAHVYGLHTASAWGSSDINLVSVGRDGNTVTIVRWSRLGTFQHAQVADFKKTTVTAVNRLH